MSINKLVKIFSLIMAVILFVIFIVSIFVWRQLIITGFVGYCLGIFVGWLTKDFAVDLVESQYKQKSSEEGKEE